MRTKLTKRIVESAQIGSETSIIWDTEVRGFGVKITSRGRRSYFLYYRTASGQQRRPTIGLHGSVTVDEARQIARKWFADVAGGIDVSAKRIADRRAESVSDLAKRYLAEYAAVYKKASSVSGDRAIIENHIAPQLGHMKIADVRRADIERCMRAIRDGKTARKLQTHKTRGRRHVRGGAIIANRTLALLSKMFACAEIWELVSFNPARRIRKYRECRKDRFLDSNEITRLLSALDESDQSGLESRFATAAIRFLLYTGMRSGEIRQLRWIDIDLSTNFLRLADSKVGARIIALSGQATAILNSLPRGFSETLVFQSSRSDQLLALTRPWYRIRKMAAIDSTATLHTLRHTFASWSVMDGESLAQVGAVLGHKSAQTTLRYADHRFDALRNYSQRTGNLFDRMAQEVTDCAVARVGR